MFEKKTLGKRQGRRIGRLIFILLILTGFIGFIADAMINRHEAPTKAIAISQETPACIEDDFLPEPDPTKVLNRAWKIVRDNKIMNDRKIPPEKELVIIDGNKKIYTSLGDEEGKLGPYILAYMYEQSKLPLRHRITCK
jgi:hypothetical protein